ncbi:hypothetical protein FKM82_016249 [Ascaphus truei]
MFREGWWAGAELRVLGMHFLFFLCLQFRHTDQPSLHIGIITTPQPRNRGACTVPLPTWQLLVFPQLTPPLPSFGRRLLVYWS